jgi:hypothetical protein
MENYPKLIRDVFFALIGLVFLAFLVNAAVFGVWKKTGYLGRFANCQAGRIIEIRNDKLVLSEEGQTIPILLGKETEIRKGRSVGSNKDLAVGQYVLVASKPQKATEGEPAELIRIFDKSFSAYSAEKLRSFLKLF